MKTTVFASSNQNYRKNVQTWRAASLNKGNFCSKHTIFLVLRC